MCVCVNGSCCGPGPGGPRGWPRQADFSHVVPSHKLPAFTSITFTGTSRVVANTGQGQGGNNQGKLLEIIVVSGPPSFLTFKNRNLI